MEPVTPVVSPITSSRQHLLDYSYAYYPSDSGHFHAAYPTDVLLQQQQQQQQQQEQQQHQQLLLRQSQQQLQIRSDPLKRHTYTTCYGTEENIYEEISEINKQCHRALHGSRRSLVAEEVRRVQSRHRRVLGELNLSVEAMLMPTVVDNNEEEMTQEDAHGTSTEELLPSVGCPADDLLSRVGCDMDSGFSGSSTASYRSGLENYYPLFVWPSLPFPLRIS
ncbi:transcription factor RBF1 isoform X2 [Pogonomyrmex barbatus]|nr:transcription factor RBF1 isoform X2 [Pogonomyrmex barbatus]